MVIQKRRRWLPQNRLLRIVVLFVLAFGLLEAIYVVVANIALAVAAKRFADRAPVSVTFERAFTWIPGRVHFRDLHVRGTAGDKWSVAIADADVTFDRKIETITANVTDVEVESKGARRRSHGALHVVVSNLTIDDARVSFDANAKVESATLENGSVVLANDVHGTIALHVAPVDTSHHSLLDTTSGTIALDGVFLSLEPLASFASLTTTQDRGTVHVVGLLDAGLLRPTSEIDAHSAHATLKDATGASADFPRGLDVKVEVAPVAPTELHLIVRTPTLVFASKDPSVAPDTFDDFELIVPAGSSDLKAGRLAMTSLAWSAHHMTFHEGASMLDATADGNVRFEMGHVESLVSSGVIHATNVIIENPDVTDRTPFDAQLTLDRLTISRERGIALHGHLHASGPDATPLLELFVSSPSIRRELVALPRHPFSVDTSIDRSEGHLALDGLSLERGELIIRGGYMRRDTETHGAFLVEGGPLPVGVVMTGHEASKKESIVLAPPAHWLEREIPKP